MYLAVHYCSASIDSDCTVVEYIKEEPKVKNRNNTPSADFGQQSRAKRTRPDCYTDTFLVIVIYCEDKSARTSLVEEDGQ